MALAINIGPGIEGGRVHRIPFEHRARRITPEAGRALEILGHAIEYLTDEYVDAAKKPSSSDPQVEAIYLLMSLNRQIYFECPVVTTFWERLLAFLHARTV